MKLNFDQVMQVSTFAQIRRDDSTKLGWAIRNDLLPQFKKKVDKHRSRKLKPLEDLKFSIASVYTEGVKKGNYIEEESGIHPQTGAKTFKKIYTPAAQAQINELFLSISDELEDHLYEIKPCLLEENELPNDLSPAEREVFLGLLIKAKEGETIIYQANETTE